MSQPAGCDLQDDSTLLAFGMTGERGLQHDRKEEGAGRNDCERKIRTKREILSSLKKQEKKTLKKLPANDLYPKDWTNKKRPEGCKSRGEIKQMASALSRCHFV